MGKPKKVDPTMRITSDGRVYRKGKKYYGNKDTYDGEFLDGMRHGKGTMTFGAGHRYVGEFQRDQYHGFGTFNYAPYRDQETQELFVGRRYEGEWKNGKYDGRGIYMSGNGDTYSGYLQKGLYHGEGTLRCKNEDMYIGEWMRGKAEGNMRIKYHDGSEYEGMTSGGRYHGVGKLIFPQGLGIYDGDWSRGKMHGKGSRSYSNGSKYIGGFRDGEPHGEGICMYVNGDQYIGEWASGFQTGRGVMKYASGDVYEGEFYHGFMFGYGKYTYADGGYYEGEFRRTITNPKTGQEGPDPDGKRHGMGVRVWTTGAKYMGDWAADRMNGNGTLTSLEGSTYKGDLWNGMRHGQAEETFGNLVGLKYTCPMGNKHLGNGFCTYKGGYVCGYFEGHGEFRCQDGRYYVGEWKRSMRHGEGHQYYLREGDVGEHHRYYIGGKHSLYRIAEYKGGWYENERHGLGKAKYVNGDVAEGNFQSGQPHGKIKYIFGQTTDSKKVVGVHKKRWAEYVLGNRVRWLKNKTMDNASEIVGWLASLKSQMEQEEDDF